MSEHLVEKQHSLVLDTNVWLDWLLFDDPSIAYVKKVFTQQKIVLLACPLIEQELAHVLHRDQFKPALQTRSLHADDLINQWLTQVSLRSNPMAGNTLICRDTDDQVFIDLALEQHATALISKDKQVLKLAKLAKRQHALFIGTSIQYTTHCTPHVINS